MIELEKVTIEGNTQGPHLLITGGVHGDEYEPMACVRRLIHELHPDAIHGKLTLVPCVNQPAFDRAERTADDGLDLARVCPGDADGSTTMQIAAALSELIRSADYYIDLHTGGRRYDILSMVGYCLVSDEAILETQRRMAQAFNMPIIWGTTPNLNGRSLSVARDAKVPAIYAEWGGPSPMAPEAVEEYTLGCLGVMVELGMLDRPRPDSITEYVIEDDSENSGHLQINNPTPVAGFWQSAVQLGQIVDEGQLLGTVTDPLGDNITEVRAAQAGMVLVLRALHQIDEGEMTAVILPGIRSATG